MQVIINYIYVGKPISNIFIGYYNTIIIYTTIILGGR